MRKTRDGFRKPAAIAAAGAALLLATAGAAAAQVTDYREIEYPELAEFVIPSPEIFELDNGMKVFLLEDHELPLVQVLARIRTGAAWEPVEKTGLAELLGTVQRTGGTGRMSGDEIDDFLEARAATVETSMSNTVAFASMDCLKEDFDEVFEVFHDVLRSPRFAEDKLEIAKVQMKSSIARRNDNVNAIAGREFFRLVYGYDSPLSRMEEYATVEAVTREDLLAWHARDYHPNNVYLGVVGDFDSAKMKEKVRARFSGWPRGPEAERREVPYRKERAASTFFIEKPDVNQANVQLGHLGITYHDPDFFAVQVMNEVLGGGFASRLFSRIRSEKGLAYSVGGGVGAAFDYPGLAGFSLQTKSETMGEAVDALYEELRGMVSDPVTADELARAKDSILNSFVFNYASKRQVLGQQMLYAYYGLPLDFLEKYRANIEMVTADDVARVAEKYLHPDEAVLLVVGREEDFDRPMSAFGEVTALDISIPPPPAAARAERTEESAERGRAVLASVAAALGGESPEAASAVKVVADVVLSMGEQSMSVEQSALIVFPDRIHVAMRAPMGEQEVVIDGAEGFMKGGGQVIPLSPERVERQLADLGRDLNYLVRYSGDPELEAVAAGEEEVDGAACRVLEVTYRGASSRLWVDEGGRVVRQAYQGEHPVTGAPGEFEVSLSDYREVEGRQIPFQKVIRIDGTEAVKVTIKSFEVDPAFDPTLFERPAA